MLCATQQLHRVSTRKQSVDTLECLQQLSQRDLGAFDGEFMDSNARLIAALDTCCGAPSSVQSAFCTRFSDTGGGGYRERVRVSCVLLVRSCVHGVATSCAQPFSALIPPPPSPPSVSLRAVARLTTAFHAAAELRRRYHSAGRALARFGELTHLTPDADTLVLPWLLFAASVLLTVWYLWLHTPFPAVQAPPLVQTALSYVPAAALRPPLPPPSLRLYMRQAATVALVLSLLLRWVWSGDARVMWHNVLVLQPPRLWFAATTLPVLLLPVVGTYVAIAAVSVPGPLSWSCGVGGLVFGWLVHMFLLGPSPVVVPTKQSTRPSRVSVLCRRLRKAWLRGACHSCLAAGCRGGGGVLRRACGCIVASCRRCSRTGRACRRAVGHTFMRPVWGVKDFLFPPQFWDVDQTVSLARPKALTQR